MAIRPRGAKWQADAKVDGKRLRRDFGSEAEAKAWAAEQAAIELRRLAQVQSAALGPNGPRNETVASRRAGDMFTWGEAVERTCVRYYDNKKDGPKLRTQLARVTALWGEHRPLNDLRQVDLDDLVASLKGAGLSPATVNRYLAVVSKVLTFAAARGVPLSLKIEREQESAGRIRWLTGTEEAHLLRVMRQWEKHDHADAVAVLIDTGMRGGELWALEARDVEIKSGAIRIWRNKTELPRSVYMTPRVREIMSARLERFKGSNTGRLFPYEDWWLRPVWDRARAHMGLMGDGQFIPYVCRHTCASRLVQRGVGLAVVMAWLGHKSMAMTMRYAHLAPQNLADAASVLAQVGDD